MYAQKKHKKRVPSMRMEYNMTTPEQPSLLPLETEIPQKCAPTWIKPKTRPPKPLEIELTK